MPAPSKIAAARYARRARLAVRASATILLPIAVAGCAGNPPQLQEGLWDIRAQRIENPGEKHTEFAYKLCRDHAYDKAANARIKDVKGCATLVKDLGGGKFSSASTCTVANVTIESNGVSVFKNGASTHSETHATYTPAFNGRTEETMTQDQQYIGKCPAGTKPGDMIYPDGLVRHHD